MSVLQMRIVMRNSQAQRLGAVPHMVGLDKKAACTPARKTARLKEARHANWIPVIPITNISSYLGSESWSL